MKRNFTFSIKSLAMAAAAAATAACSDYSPEEYDGNLTQEEYKTIVEYTKNFEDRYGTIDPNQDWGFGELEVKEGTRSTRGRVEVNNNQLFTAVKENNKTVDYQTPVVNGQHLVVPGCPSVSDGKYYLASGVYQDKQALLAAGVGDGPNIKGDVTNDEIVYVSNWFRTHKDPKTNTNYGVGSDGLIKAQCVGLEEMKLSSFFIQLISGDYDRKSLTDLNYRQEKNKNGSSVEFKNMDKLEFKTTKSDYTHANNFNAGPGINRIDQWNPNGYGNTYSNREIKWIINDDEEEYVKDFRYWGSDDSQYHNEYVIMYLEFEKNGVTYKGTYLGFDYEAYKQDDGVYWNPDGYYNNWIVKISDALPKTISDPDNTVARIICEDLGNTDDFDFNDLVFDVYYTKDNNSYTAHITVQAVGGTLPIYIGTDVSAANELHSRMGYSDMKPINVGATGGHDGVSPCNLTVSNLSTTNPDDIIICVQRGSNQATPTILPKSTGASSLAPQKICIKNGQSFRWMRESQQIETGYLKFAKWVENKSAFGENGFWSSSTDIDTRFLY